MPQLGIGLGDFGQGFGSTLGRSAGDSTSISSSSSSSGFEFLDPRQKRAFYQTLGDLQSRIGGFGNMDASAYQQFGGTPYEFTMPNLGPVWTPNVLNEAVNSIWGDVDARTATQQRNIRQGAQPGTASNSPVLQELAQNAANVGRGIGTREQQGLQQRAQLENAQRELDQAQLLAQVQAQAALDARNRQAYGLTARGQDTGLLGALSGILAGMVDPRQRSRSNAFSYSHTDA
jgi:hypothetical protein